MISQLDLKMAELSHVTLPALVTIALVLVSWLELAWGPIRGEHCGHVTRSPPITAHLWTIALGAVETGSRKARLDTRVAGRLR